MQPGEGHDRCPSCDSPEWKSAKTIILEGTTFSEGELEGSLNEPGWLSGGIRAFLLADRWFSWEKKIKGAVTTTTTTALVEVVEQYMRVQGAMVQMPLEPNEPAAPTRRSPPKIGWFEKAAPVKPTPPAEPEALPIPPPRPWYAYVWLNVKDIIALSIFAGVLVMVADGPFLRERGLQIDYAETLMLGASAIALALLISIRRSFGADQKVRASIEQQNRVILERHKTAIKEYERDYAEYVSDCQKAEIQKYQHKKALEQHQRECEQDRQKYEQQLATYRARKREYLERKEQVLRARAMLWERTRVCRRCSTCYPGVLKAT